MKRPYKTKDETDSIDFFVGEEIEYTIMHGRKTLFVVGTHSAELVKKIAQEQAVDHVYLGANQSFYPDDQFISMANYLLDSDFFVTLDYPVQHHSWINNYSDLCLHPKFINMISVAIPYINNLNSNATLKIDDQTFAATNPGVWTHRLHNLKDSSVMTNWSQYSKDKIINVDQSNS